MKRISFLIAALTLIGIAFGIDSVLAKPESAPIEQASPLHPSFAILDKDGVNVLESGSPVSTMKTCGECHDTEFIQSHAFHSDLGLSDYKENGGYDTSPGTFGKWDPLTYRFLSQKGDERLDLSTAEWLKLYGDRVVGGGPATTSRTGQLLTDLKADPNDPEASILNTNGKVEGWDWNAWGTMEMNCFLCHLENPNNQLRVSLIRSGNFDGANTATLIGTGIVTDQVSDSWTYNPEAFDENGELKAEFVKIQDPTNANCATCHGEVHTDTSQPLTLHPGDLNYPQTGTTGQVISAQKISESGVNLSGKAELIRSWDVHAERQLQCTDCHYAINNPAHADEAQ
jgi:cytochrome c553